MLWWGWRRGLFLPGLGLAAKMAVPSQPKGSGGCPRVAGGEEASSVWGTLPQRVPLWKERYVRKQTQICVTGEEGQAPQGLLSCGPVRFIQNTQVGYCLGSRDGAVDGESHPQW